jgi:hypothetical protein
MQEIWEIATESSRFLFLVGDSWSLTLLRGNSFAKFTLEVELHGARFFFQNLRTPFQSFCRSSVFFQNLRTPFQNLRTPLFFPTLDAFVGALGALSPLSWTLDNCRELQYDF